mmetsp:Transcript_121483/g.378115  ORF Transcript_121483/g.378115 Transcript_121483/m.378115 type:complete len:210 (-) Transcript_121483:808-1437(-)
MARGPLVTAPPERHDLRPQRSSGCRLGRRRGGRRLCGRVLATAMRKLLRRPGHPRPRQLRHHSDPHGAGAGPPDGRRHPAHRPLHDLRAALPDGACGRRGGQQLRQGLRLCAWREPHARAAGDLLGRLRGRPALRRLRQRHGRHRGRRLCAAAAGRPLHRGGRRLRGHAAAPAPRHRPHGHPLRPRGRLRPGAPGGGAVRPRRRAARLG